MPTVQSTPLLDQLDALDDRVKVVQQRARALAEESATTTNAIDPLRQGKVEAHADDDEERAKRLASKRSKLELTLAELEERRAGAELAASRAQQERDRFVVERWRAISRERAPRAHATVAALQRHTQALTEAVAAWVAEEQAQLALLRQVDGVDGRAVRDIGPIGQLITDLARTVQAGVPVPLPNAAPTTGTWTRDELEAIAAIEREEQAA